MTPLENPTYDPVHKPYQGFVPWVVEKWNASSQVRWFNRFRSELLSFDTERYHTQSVAHKGDCCWSCIEDRNDGYYDFEGCCCYEVPKP